MPTPYLDPAQNGQRDQITQALMNIASPPPQMPQQGMPQQGAPPPPMGGPAPQAGAMPPQQGMPPPGMPVGGQQPMMAGALGGLMSPQPQAPQQPQPQMPPQGMPQQGY